MIIGWLAWLTVGWGCQQWICAELADGVCAEWDESTVKVNSKQPGIGKKCYLLGLELEKGWSAEGSYKAEDMNLEMMAPPINCHAGKAINTYNKSHPIKCYKDSHCKANDKNRKCVCSMDGNGYCELLEGDRELAKYKMNCGELSEGAAFAWYLYIDLFPLMHKVPKCAQNLFEEIQVFKRYAKMLEINMTEAFGYN
jgi:hypothetical protein